MWLYQESCSKWAKPAAFPKIGEAKCEANILGNDGNYMLLNITQTYFLSKILLLTLHFM
ncbi:hypothetical protein SAMN03159358_3103 [Paenibacillus sp. NFR01]|nr:hypothetical protein SAMN03159358_3103 [Paenibacillus sp. NFR01]